MNKRKKHTSSFKFRIALEALKGESTNTEIGRKYNLDPSLISKWKSILEKQGYKAFDHGLDENKSLKKQKAALEQLLGRKEVEINLMKNFLEDYDYQDTR